MYVEIIKIIKNGMMKYLIPIWLKFLYSGRSVDKYYNIIEICFVGYQNINKKNCPCLCVFCHSMQVMQIIHPVALCITMLVLIFTGPLTQTGVKCRRPLSAFC